MALETVTVPRGRAADVSGELRYRYLWLDYRCRLAGWRMRTKGFVVPVRPNYVRLNFSPALPVAARWTSTRFCRACSVLSVWHHDARG